MIAVRTQQIRGLERIREKARKGGWIDSVAIANKDIAWLQNEINLLHNILYTKNKIEKMSKTKYRINEIRYKDGSIIFCPQIQYNENNETHWQPLFFDGWNTYLCDSFDDAKSVIEKDKKERLKPLISQDKTDEAILETNILSETIHEIN